MLKNFKRVDWLQRSIKYQLKSLPGITNWWPGSLQQRHKHKSSLRLCVFACSKIRMWKHQPNLGLPICPPVLAAKHSDLSATDAWVNSGIISRGFLLHIYNLYFEYLYTNITKSLLCTFANSFATVMGPYPKAVNKHANPALYRESLLYLSVIRGTSVI